MGERRVNQGQRRKQQPNSRQNQSQSRKKPNRGGVHKPQNKRSRPGEERTLSISRILFPIGIVILAIFLGVQLRLFELLINVAFTGVGIILFYFVIAVVIFKQPKEKAIEDIKTFLIKLFTKSRKVAGSAYKGSQRMYDSFIGNDEYDDEIEEYDVNMGNEDPFGDDYDEEDYEEDEYDEEFDDTQFDYGQAMEEEGDVQPRPAKTLVAQGSVQNLGSQESVKIIKNSNTVTAKGKELTYTKHRGRMIQTHINEPMDTESMTTVLVGENVELDIYGGNIMIEGNKIDGIRIYTDTMPQDINQEPMSMKIQSGGETIQVHLYGTNRVQFKNVKATSEASIFSDTVPSSMPDSEAAKIQDRMETDDKEFNWDVKVGLEDGIGSMGTIFDEGLLDDSLFNGDLFLDDISDVDNEVSQEDLDDIAGSLEVK